MDEIEREGESRGPSRRTVVTAAAWTVPAIAVAAALPMAAASQNPVWDPSTNGVGGQLNATLPNTVSGYANASYGLSGDAPDSVRIPQLTATWTVSGAWQGTPTLSLGSGSATNGLQVGSVITYQGLTWTVTSNTGIVVVMVSTPITLPGSTSVVRTPTVNVSGPGDGSGNDAKFGVSLAGGQGTSGATFNVSVPSIP